MPGLLDQIVLRDRILEDLQLYTQPCRQRILIVTDSPLDFSPGNLFGLSRLVGALRSYTPMPTITLAHRNFAQHNVVIDGASYTVLGGFNFATATVPVTVANYDQIWMFGFKTGPAAGSQANVHPLTSAEINRIGTFMNAGGGVFATGDHATLGQGMGGELPRIRRMRDWASVPMGGEGAAVARDRIDTVVDPGPGGVYEFDDQADSIPQRIYPNYRVTWSGISWTASIHPLLAMPGSPGLRTQASGFTNDMDVLPDHPHESVCREVSATTNPAELNATYSAHSLNFPEFPNAVSATGRVGSEIVAFGVSGGRSVLNGVWKPPVNPRMFGIISAFDGHKAQAYPGAPTRPGRIVCDSTWHHYVNVNIDGSGSGRTGLGSIVGGVWTPSAAGQKVFQYYRNIVAYLVPLNRRSCRFVIDLMAAQLHPSLIEELVQVDDFRDPAHFEGLGLEAARLIDSVHGKGAAVEAVRSALRLDGGTVPLADPAEGDLLVRSDGEAGPIVTFTLGKALAALAQALPLRQPDELRKAMKRKDHESLEKDILHVMTAAAVEAVELQIERTERRSKQLIACSPRRPRPRPLS